MIQVDFLYIVYDRENKSPRVLNVPPFSIGPDLSEFNRNVPKATR